MTNPLDLEKKRTPIHSIRINSNLKKSLPYFSIEKGLEELMFSIKSSPSITLEWTTVIFNTKEYDAQNQSIRETYEFVLDNQRTQSSSAKKYSEAVLKLNMHVLSEFNQLDDTQCFHDVYEYETAVEQLLTHFMIIVNTSIFTKEDRIRLMGHSYLMMIRNTLQVLRNPNSKINEGGTI